MDGIYRISQGEPFFATMKFEDGASLSSEHIEAVLKDKDVAVKEWSTEDDDFTFSTVEGVGYATITMTSEETAELKIGKYALEIAVFGPDGPQIGTTGFVVKVVKSIIKSGLEEEVDNGNV